MCMPHNQDKNELKDYQFNSGIVWSSSLFEQHVPQSKNYKKRKNIDKHNWCFVSA